MVRSRPVEGRQRDGDQSEVCATTRGCCAGRRGLMMTWGTIGQCPATIDQSQAMNVHSADVTTCDHGLPKL